MKKKKMNIMSTRLLLALGIFVALNTATTADDLGIGVKVDKFRYVLGQDNLAFTVSESNQGTSTQQIDVHVGFISPDGQVYELPD